MSDLVDFFPAPPGNIHDFPVGLRVRAPEYSPAHELTVTGHTEQYVICHRTERPGAFPFYYMPHELEAVDVRDITAGPATSRHTWETTR